MIEGTVVAIPRYNGAEVTVTFSGLENNSGVSAKLTRKATRRTPDAGAKTYTAAISAQMKSVFTVPPTDNGTAGMEWYRVDVVSDGSGEPRTAVCGPLVISPV